jgi:hypothetical protein
MTIDIICKVVDNYGDIGVVYRLARALAELDTSLKLRLVVDDLAAFRALEPSVDPAESLQEVRGWIVAGWVGRKRPSWPKRPRRVIRVLRLRPARLVRGPPLRSPGRGR